MHSESGQKILISLGCWIMGYILTEAIQYKKKGFPDKLNLLEAKF
jgi:hypothetical protein